MPWKTTNLIGLKQTEYWNTFPEGFKNTLVEEKVFLPSWRRTFGFPTGTVIDSEKKTVTFPKDMKPDDLEYIYNANTKQWIYLKSSSSFAQYSGTWLDNRTFQLNTSWAATDKLTGSVWRTVEYDDPMFNNGFKYGDSPVEWDLPIVFLDPKQINDKRTYDGSFPVTVVPITQAAACTKTDTPLVWARITDLIDYPTGGSTPAPVVKTDDALLAKLKKYEDLISELKSKLSTV